MQPLLSDAARRLGVRASRWPLFGRLDGAESTIQQNVIADTSATEIERPDLYLNREQSWIEFNRRVFQEAQNTHHPLLERVKFLSIFDSNLDEFIMIRIAGLKDQLAAHVTTPSPDGLTAEQQLAAPGMA